MGSFKNLIDLQFTQIFGKISQYVNVANECRRHWVEGGNEDLFNQ